jgi:transcription initiation factor TFIIIB Brf1 subunit/transcription initiation factor TFIIB
MWLKACPRCLGDLILEADLYGQYVACLQCGCVLNEQQIRLLPMSTRSIPRAARHRGVGSEVRKSPRTRAA